MTVIRPFQSIRPARESASSIAALPYDVYSRKEAKEIVQNNSLSFLKIDRAETQFPDDTDMYSTEVYERARDTLKEMIAEEAYVQDAENCFYLYSLTMNCRTQTGIVGCAAIDDYLNGSIKRHENTREDKELDRIRHVDTMSAQTGPIFLAYRQNHKLHSIIIETMQCTGPLYDFTSDDGVQHQVWQIQDWETCKKITDIFSEIDHIYIADGHHRAASAVKVGLKRRAEHPDYDGSEEFNYFLSVLFPAEELMIYDYNRVVDGLNGQTFEELLNALKESFIVEETAPSNVGLATEGNDETFSSHFRPQRKGEIALYGNGTWYKLTALPHLYTNDPVDDLDVSILQNAVLKPLLGITDIKTDPRIRFVGGIRGLNELVKIVDESSERIAFAMYPTSMDELLSVADAGRLMPPKSTWFEPKLRSGLFIHEIER